MKAHKTHMPTILKDERGVYAPMVAGSLLMFLAILGLTIDIGQALVAKNELHDTADAGALAGTRYLATLYQAIPTTQHATYTIPGSDAAALINLVVRDRFVIHQHGN